MPNPPLPSAFRGHRLLPLAIAAGLALPAAVHAQAPDPARTLDAVVVTAPIARAAGSATKTDTPLLEIPQSISVIDARQMRDRGVQGIDEAVWYTAGTQGAAFGPDPRTDWLLVRGFAPARYLDGLALPDGSSTGITRIEPYGLERVDVLKGPASVNYGAMPPGGMLNYTSKRPTADAFGEVELQGGSHDMRQAALDLGGPLDADGVWRYRLTGLARNSDDVVDFVHDDRYYIAPALTWQPDADTSLTLLGRWQHADTMAGGGFLPAEGTLLPNPNGPIPVNRYTGEPGWNRYDRTDASFGYAFEHHFGDGTRVRQNLRYGSSEVAPSTTVGALGLLEDQRSLSRYLWATAEASRTFGVDNQIEFSFGDRVQHTVLAGLDHRRSRNTYASAFVISDADGNPAVAPLDLFDPVYGSPVVVPDYTSDVRQVQRQTGLYVQDQIRAGRWVLSIGGRHDWVGTDTTERLGAGSRAHQSDDRFSGRVGVNYVFDNGFAPYVGYSESFQPTIGNEHPERGGRAFVPTTGAQVEAGLKYQPAHGRALATLALYEITQENTLTVDPDHTFFQVQQGETRVRGAELETRWNVAPNFGVHAAYAYIDSEITRSNEAAALGAEIPLQPRTSASAGFDYTFVSGPLTGFGFGGGVRYVGAHYGDLYNEWRTPSYTLYDAALHYDTGPWRFQLNAQNLTDREYVSACSSAAWCYYGFPRRVTASIRYQW